MLSLEIHKIRYHDEYRLHNSKGNVVILPFPNLWFFFFIFPVKSTHYSTRPSKPQQNQNVYVISHLLYGGTFLPALPKMGFARKQEPVIYPPWRGSNLRIKSHRIHAHSALADIHSGKRCKKIGLCRGSVVLCVLVRWKWRLASFSNSQVTHWK